MSRSTRNPRAHAVEGALEVASTIDVGTTVTGRIPIGHGTGTTGVAP